MPRSPPEPLIVLTGFRGGVASTAVLQLCGRVVLAVGTTSGVLSLYNPMTYLLEKTIYEDPENRAILSIGIREKDGKSCLWAFVRGDGILEFDGEQMAKWISTDFVGFAGAIGFGADLIYPVSDGKSKSGFRTTINGDWTKTKLLYEIPKMEEISSEDDSLGASSPEATPLCIALTKDHLLLVGDDAGRIHSVDVKTGNFTVIRPLRTPIFSLAAQGENLAFGSEKPPLQLMRFPFAKGANPMEIQYPQSSQGCSALAFSPTGKTLLTGFWDGSVRVYSMKSKNILLYLPFHKQTITNLLWSAIKVNEIEEERVFIGSRDETLSIWQFAK